MMAVSQAALPAATRRRTSRSGGANSPITPLSHFGCRPRPDHVSPVAALWCSGATTCFGVPSAREPVFAPLPPPKLSVIVRPWSATIILTERSCRETARRDHERRFSPTLLALAAALGTDLKVCLMAVSANPPGPCDWQQSLLICRSASMPTAWETPSSADLPGASFAASAFGAGAGVTESGGACG